MAAIKLLLDAGSGSLGGARPKASVRDGKLLKIAKFPHSSDAWDVMAWEKTALDLAERAHIQCPTRELVKVSSQNVLLLDRFDRGGDNRIPYLSAMSLMQVKDGSHSDYVELAEALAQHSSRAHNDLQELWRRIAFSIAINNTDDHMRNHGFLREPSGWLLSPIFDINPDPDSNKQRVTGINYITEPTQCQDALNSASEYFGITNEDAASIWSEIREALSECRTVERHS
ncbi:MAG: HipA domain-containing protein [Actinomycetota bacterium]|nr:HipA domain-containing protein [Actinomycetota bacterium]